MNNANGYVDIVLSQSDALPNDYTTPSNDSFYYAHECGTKFTDCRLIIDPDKLDPKKPVYIGFESNGTSFDVIVAGKDHLIEELYEHKDNKGTLYLQ